MKIAALLCFSTGIVASALPALAANAPAPAVVGLVKDAPQATLVAPAPGSASDFAAPVFVVSTAENDRVELRVDGRVASEKQIGKRTFDTRTGETKYWFYGVALDEGPNRVDVTAIDASGERGETSESTIFGPGAPVTIHLSIEGILVADGRTPASVVVTALDRYGHHALPGSIVKLGIVRGDAAFASLVAAAASPQPSPLAAGAAENDAATTPLAPAPVATPTLSARTAGGAAGLAAPMTGEPANARAIGGLDTQTTSIDVPLEAGGISHVPLVPGLKAGELELRASYGDELADARSFVSPEIRAPLVVGVASAGIGSVPGVPGENPGDPNGADSRRGRIAVYGSGAVSEHALATFAYDTADVLDRTNAYGAFTDNPDQRPYLTYGDASTRRSDALSQDRLYARIDDGRSNVMWGEFQAQTGTQGGIGGFNELVSGAKIELAGPAAKIVAFNAHNQVAYARQVFSPTGLATLGTALRPDIVVGSDVVSLVALDRHSGAILTQTVLARNVDYVLDYGSGTLRFLNVPLPFDANFDPQQILVQYQYQGANSNSETTGGRVEAQFGSKKQLHAAAGYVNDTTGSGGFSLFSQDVGGALQGGAWSIGHMQATGAAAGAVTGLTGLGTGSAIGTGSTLAGNAADVSGNAYQASLATTLGAAKIAAGFDATTAGFDNPFGGLATPGLLDYRLSYARTFGTARPADLAFSFDHEQNNLPGAENAQSNVSVKIREKVTHRFNAIAGVVVRSLSGPTAALDALTPTAPAATNAAAANASGGLAQAQLGFEYKLAPHVEIDAQRQFSLGGVQDAYAPAETTAQISADINGHGRVYLRQLWSDAPTQSFASASSQLTTLSGATRSTVLGVEQTVGSGTTVDDEYGIDRTANGGDVYSALGVRQRFVLGKNVKGSLTFQHANSLGANASGFVLYGAQVAYGVARFHSSVDAQIRTGNAAGFSLDAGAAGALSRDVSLFGVANTSSVGGYRIVDDRISLAVRPAESERFESLLGFEAKNGDIATVGAHTQLLSIEELVRPIPAIEVAGRYALKLDGDAFYTAGTSLVGLRVDGRLTRHFDLATELRQLNVGNAAAATRALAIEAGERLGDSFRLAAGYNFSGSPDPALASAPTRKGVYASATTIIDRIFGWGKDAP